jgi:hypothetical protein
MDILRSLWKVGCNDIQVFLNLFDIQVQPALTYSAEVWGMYDSSQIEKVHMYACKKLLSVSQKTPNTLIYGELGRYPLHINAQIKAIKYWLRLVEMADDRIPKAAYNKLKELNDKDKDTWVGGIKSCLCRNGFGNVWMFQEVGNKNAFLRVFKQRLIDCFAQNWQDKIHNSQRLSKYGEIKNIFVQEHYLSLPIEKRFRDTIARLRMGVNELASNKYRYSPNIQLRSCPICNAVEEDEIHFIFMCKAYDCLRNDKLPAHCLTQTPSAQDYSRLFQPAYIVLLAKYCTSAFKLRNELITT